VLGLYQLAADTAAAESGPPKPRQHEMAGSWRCCDDGNAPGGYRAAMPLAAFRVTNSKVRP